jgi:branched-chain amino acid aminotransferase
LVKNGKLTTPPKDAGILEGITRNAVIELAQKAGIPFEEVTMTRYDVYTSDECFLTGTAAEIIAVTKCDSRPIGSGKPGPMTKQLRELFQELTKE